MAKKMVIIVFLILLLLPNILSAQIQVLAPAYPPQIIPDGSGYGSTTGIATEMVLAAAEIADIEVLITILPWPRAYQTTVDETDVMLIPVIRNAEREQLFEWVGPVSRYEYVVYKRVNSQAPRIDSLNDLNNRNVGSITNDAATRYLEQNGFNHLIEFATLERLFLSLMVDRIDYIVASPAALSYMLNQTGRSMNSVEKMFSLDGVTDDPQNYLVLKKGSDPALIAAFRDALVQMQNSGQWDAIYDKYTR